MSNIRILKEDNVNLLRRRCLSGIPFVFAATAFICSYISNFACTNVEFIPQQQTATENDFFRPRSVSFGLWMYQSQRMTTVQDGEILFTEFCTGYDDHSIHVDMTWKVARVVSVLGIIIAGFLLLWQFTAPFLLFDANYWRVAIILFLVLAILQGSTLLFLQSSACLDNALIYSLVYNPSIYPSQCSWDTSTTRTSIVGALFYAITAISMTIIPAPGTRPKERPYPMMVWDTTTTNGDSDEDDEDEDDVASFAYDTEIENDDFDDDFKSHGRNKMSTWREQQDVTDTSYSSNSNRDDDDVEYVQKGVGV